MMEYNYTPSQHKNTAKCRKKYQLLITNILDGYDTMYPCSEFEVILIRT